MAVTTTGMIGVRFFRMAPVPLIHTSASYTVDAGAEVELAAVRGRPGITAGMILGDGSPELIIRVYVDGNLASEIKASEYRGWYGVFTDSLEIKLYNPGATTVTGNSSTFQGVALTWF